MSIYDDGVNCDDYDIRFGEDLDVNEASARAYREQVRSSESREERWVWLARFAAWNELQLEMEAAEKELFRLADRETKLEG